MRKYPVKKDRDMTAKEKEGVRVDLQMKKLSTLEISKKWKCSWSQVCGVKAAMTKGL